MNKAQERLDQLLKLTNEELDRAAAECQGWKLEEDLSGDIWDGPEGIIEVRDWTPSTDLNQSWGLAESMPQTLIAFRKDYIQWYWEEWVRPFTAHRDENSLARILTAFGVLCRELDSGHSA